MQLLWGSAIFDQAIVFCAEGTIENNGTEVFEMMREFCKCIPDREHHAGDLSNLSNFVKPRCGMIANTLGWTPDTSISNAVPSSRS